MFRVGISSKGPITLPQDAEVVLKPEDWEGLDKEQDITIRIKTMQDLTPLVKNRRLEECAVERLWFKIRDLARSTSESERNDTWLFLEAIIRGQYDQLDIMRAEFFRLIKSSVDHGEGSLEQQIHLIDALTQKGREILHFEEEIGVLMQKIWPYILTSECQEFRITFLQIVINLLTFNSAYVDSEVVVSFIRAFSKMCSIGKSFL